MTHSQKKKLARSMLTHAELKEGVSVFNSAQWNIRRIARETKELKKHSKTHG